MHQIQKILLHRLLSGKKLRYFELTHGYDFDDNIVFHLKQLLKNDLIEKKGNEYTITTTGVKRIASFDLPTLEDAGFKTFFLGFLCENRGEYLIKEHPNGKQNFYNLPSGKPRFGEPVDDALVRTFFKNTGLKLKPKNFIYHSLHLKTVVTPEDEILFDDAFAIYDVKIEDKEREQMKLIKEISWASEEKIKSLPNRWTEIDLCILKKDRSTYLNYKFTSNYTLG